MVLISNPSLIFLDFFERYKKKYSIKSRYRLFRRREALEFPVPATFILAVSMDMHDRQSSQNEWKKSANIRKTVNLAAAAAAAGWIDPIV